MVALSSFLDTGDKVASIVGGVVGVAGLWIAVRARSSRRRRMPRDTQIGALLEAQRADSARHRYRFFGDHVPALSDLYVQPRARPDDPEIAQPNRSIEATQVLTGRRHGVLLGDAGAGKSTFLATVAGQLARQAVSHRGTGEIAVIVQASDLLGRTLPEALSHAVHRDFGIETPVELFDRPPSGKGVWRVMVDGLDEVVDAYSRSTILWRLRDLLTGTGPHRFLITSRPLSEPELTELRGSLAGVYDLRPFDRQQLAEFARKWFATRHADDRRRAEEMTGLFLARIAGARLGPVARVPLLATIAALVHESQEDRTLPSSRAKLYDRFVDHLLDGRRSMERFREAIDPELLKRGSAGKDLAEWMWSDLHRHISGLLDACGAASVANPDAQLTEVAAGWLRENGPHDPTRIAPDGDRLVRELLLATGVCTIRRERVLFAHQSFAEYFAARAGAADFDATSWLALARNPLSRSLAAFAVARRPDSDNLVTALFQAGDVTAAGDLLADGVPVAHETSTRIVDSLVTQVVEETDLAPDALRLLAELSIDAQVLDRMTAVAERSDVATWTRALVADLVADVSPDLGNALLRQVARDADYVARSWIVDSLEEHGEWIDPWFLEPSADDGLTTRAKPLGVLARQALAQRLNDARTTETERLEAATQLAGEGDLAPLRAMADAADVEPMSRVRIASALADVGEPASLRGLAAADSNPPSAAYAAAIDLFERADPLAAGALRDIVHRFPTIPMAFGAAARAAEMGDREPLLWLVRNAGQPQIQLAAARRLAALGETAALGWLLDGELHPVVETVVIAEQFSAGHTDALSRLPALLNKRGITAYRRVELIFLMAASGDKRWRDELYRMLQRPSDSFLAVRAAVALGLSGDPRGTKWLESTAEDRGSSDQTRARALAGLADADPVAGRKVVDRLAGAGIKPGLRIRAATVAFHRWGDVEPLSRIALDPETAPDARATAAGILTDLALGAEAPNASAFYLDRTGRRPIGRRAAASTIESPVTEPLRQTLASMATDELTPAAVRVAVAPLLPESDARGLLTGVAASTVDVLIRIAAIERLDAIDHLAAALAFGQLIRDRRISRLRRWWLIATDSGTLTSADEAVLDDLVDDTGPARLIIRAGLMSLREPERVFGALH